jgi:hypothetical protein
MGTKREILIVVSALVIIAATILVMDRVVSDRTAGSLLTVDKFKLSQTR